MIRISEYNLIDKNGSMYVVNRNKSVCPLCGEELHKKGWVRRIVRTKQGEKYFVKLRRLFCNSCKKYHRELPDFLYPYKHYESEIINGVMERLITSNTLEFEDYPCEMTMTRWKTQKM